MLYSAKLHSQSCRGRLPPDDVEGSLCHVSARLSAQDLPAKRMIPVELTVACSDSVMLSL